MDDLLFYNDRRIDLSDVLRHQTEKMKADIADTPAARMNGGTDEELVEHFISKYEIEPLHIHEDQVEADHKETKVDVSHDRFRRFIRDGSGTRVTRTVSIGGSRSNSTASSSTSLGSGMM